MPLSVLPAFGLKTENAKIENFGSGLINNTWKITTPESSYILQRVNNAVFEEPENIAHNIRLIANYIHKNHPGYQFVSPLASVQGDEMVFREGEGFFRLFPFVAGSHSKDVVENPEQAYEAAVQFGRFTKLLGGLDIKQMKTTIPFFHDLSLRYEQFLQALEKGDKQRISGCGKEIEAVVKHSDIAAEYKKICHNPDFKLRVTHHDTKISNVLFDTAGKGLCVIDLDTVMPGYFISDVGDMMRTYLSPVSEEEKDFSKIMIRDEFYKAIVNGYFSEMKDELTGTEKKYFYYAGEFIIYMQAIRFLTDHLNHDIYYGVKYPGHNLVRAQNQLVLLQRLLEKENTLGNYRPE
jgi:Ser/Thr protein kinase RdoA (MazF antagonist)